MTTNQRPSEPTLTIELVVRVSVEVRTDAAASDTLEHITAIRAALHDSGFSEVTIKPIVQSKKPNRNRS